MQDEKLTEFEMTFSSYGDLMTHFSEERKIKDLCTILHSFELELLTQVSDLSLAREIKLLRNNLIIKVFLKSGDMYKNIIYLRSKKNDVAIELRKLRSLIGFYNSNEERIYYYLLMPIDDLNLSYTNGENAY